MHRLTILLTALLLFALGGAFAATTPIDYSLLCTTDAEAMSDVEVIGVATEVDGNLHVRLVDGWVCDEDSSVVVAVAVHDASVVFDVTITVDEFDGLVTLTFSHDEVEGLSGEATTLPHEAIDGMANAHTLRTAAFERQTRGAETSETAREAAGVAERPEIGIDHEGDEGGEGRPELPVTPAGGRP